MAKVMLTLQNLGEDLTLDEVVEQLQLEADEVDLEFGLQPMPPNKGSYVILVEETAAQRIDPDQVSVSGPYSDPEIETFGPPES